LFKLANLGLLESWLAARVLGPGLLTLGALHTCRWAHCDVRAGCAISMLLMTGIGLVAEWRRGWPCAAAFADRQFRRLLRRSELLLLLSALGLMLTFGYYYGPHGRGERAFDLGLVSGLMHTPGFPPGHFWAAGKELHYYYFGSLVAACLGSLARMRSHHAYFGDLVIVWLQTATAAWLFARRLGARGVAAWVCPYCMLLLGTGGALYQWATLHVNPLSAQALLSSLRVIPYTINETPPQALWASELHAHTMAVPFMIMLVLLLLHMLRRTTLAVVVYLAAVAAMLLMTDTWQVPGIALAALLLVISYVIPRAQRVAMAFWATGSALLLCVLFAAPMIIGYKGEPVRFRLLSISTTLPMHVVALFGPIGAVVLFGRAARVRAQQVIALWPLVTAAILIVAFCEIAYFDMQLPPPGERQNTVMRFHWTAYVLLALAAPVAVGQPAIPRGRKLRHLIARMLLAAVLLTFGIINLLPPVGQVLSASMRDAWTADVRRGLTSDVPALIAIGDYLEANAAPGTVIAESGGNPYRGFSYVSATTGRPAILGEIDKLNNTGIPKTEIVTRFNDLCELYANGAAADKVIAKYQIRYIVLGKPESNAFTNVHVTELLNRYKTALKRGNTWLLDVQEQRP
jgi:uncharacterized membrane protein